jgi:hypothetical protein
MSAEHIFRPKLGTEGGFVIAVGDSGVLVEHAYTYSTEETLELIDALQQAVRKHEELQNER